MANQVDVCNQVCNQIRSGVSVQSINPSDGSLAANVLSLEYQPRVDSVSRAAQWNCLRFEQQLQILRAAPGTLFNPNGQNSSAPPVPWLYEYAWPSQPWCLRVRYVFPFPPASGAAAGPIISLPSTPLTTGNIPFFPNSASRKVLSAPFAVSTDLDASGKAIKVILTNAPYAVCVYTSRVTDVDLWDPQFRDCVVMTLAAWVAPPITGSESVVKMCSQLAAGIVMGARISDGNEGTQTSDHSVDWITIRGGRSLGLQSQGVSQWDLLSLPLGAV